MSSLGDQQSSGSEFKYTNFNEFIQQFSLKKKRFIKV